MGFMIHGVLVWGSSEVRNDVQMSTRHTNHIRIEGICSIFYLARFFHLIFRLGGFGCFAIGIPPRIYSFFHKEDLICILLRHGTCGHQT